MSIRRRSSSTSTGHQMVAGTTLSSPKRIFLYSLIKGFYLKRKGVTDKESEKMSRVRKGNSRIPAKERKREVLHISPST